MSRSSSFLRSFVTSFPIFGWISRKMGRYLTRRGKVVTLAFFFFAIGSIHLDSPVYYLCGACLTLLLFTFAANRLFAPGLRYKTYLPKMISVGDPLVAKLDVENEGSFTAMDLNFRFHPTANKRMGLQPNPEERSIIDSVLPGQRVRTTVVGRASKRGVIEGPRLLMKTAFPFNLFFCSKSFVAQSTLIVAPRFRPLASSVILRQIFNRSDGEFGNSQNRGDNEFVGSREYIPGVPVRRWDYRAWAKTTKPHIRQYESLNNRSCTVLVDLAPGTEHDPDDFKSLLSLVAAVANELQVVECEIDALILGNETFKLSSSSRERQMSQLLVQLARANQTEQPLELRGIPRESQLVIFMSLGLGPDQKAICRQLEESGRTVLPICVASQVEEESSVPDASFVSPESVRKGEVWI